MGIASLRRSTRFKRLTELGEWGHEVQRDLHDAAMDLDVMVTVIAKQLEATGKSWFDIGQARWSARKAVRQWRRAAAHVYAAYDCMGRGWRDIQEQYDPKVTRAKASGSLDITK